MASVILSLKSVQCIILYVTFEYAECATLAKSFGWWCHRAAVIVLPGSGSMMTRIMPDFDHPADKSLALRSAPNPAAGRCKRSARPDSSSLLAIPVQRRGSHFDHLFDKSLASGRRPQWAGSAGKPGWTGLAPAVRASPSVVYRAPSRAACGQARSNVGRNGRSVACSGIYI